MPKNFLRLEDHTPQTFKSLIDSTLAFKRGEDNSKPLAGKNIGLIFTKSSTRTRIAFEVGVNQLGGNAIFLSPEDIQLGRGESLADTSKVMARYLDGLVVRTFEQRDVIDIATNSGIPVINALTDKYHPCQAVADYATLLEKRGDFKHQKLAYIGDGNNVAHSLIVGGAMLGVEVSIASPKGYWADDDVVDNALQLSKESGAIITIDSDPKVATKNADAVYTDVWASMGQEDETTERKNAFEGFSVTQELIALAKDDCVIMHCLPAHRGEEIEGSVLDGEHSIVWDQAENKLHAQKAVLKMVMGD